MKNSLLLGHVDGHRGSDSRWVSSDIPRPNKAGHRTQPATIMETSLRSSKSASSTTLHSPLFDSPSKRGVHHTPATYTPTERRFKWQEPSSNSTDALYKLPTYIGTSSKKSFGTSTREDWDVTRKRANPCAGPGSYESPGSCGRQSNSICRTAAFAAFENAPRSPQQSDMTPSPGPIYDLPIAIGAAPSPKIGTSTRPPLNGKSEGPGPNLALPGAFRECRPLVAPTFGTEKRLRPGIAAGNTPGAIYDLHHTGFRTGPTSSFSHAKRF